MKCRAAVLPLFAVAALFVQPLSAETTTSESERLEKLEHAVDQLQKRNAELETEVHDLRKRLVSRAEVDANGNQRPRSSPDAKTLLEKPVTTEETPPVFVVQRGPEIKLTL